MRHLVTGGAGFIGSHLIDFLMKDGDSQVICLDNYQTGCRENVEHWLSNPRFELIRHDVVEPIRLEVDQIWHLACPASPQQYQRNPISTAKTCVLGTLNMLGLAKRCNARLLFSSTSEVYGNPLVSPQSETDLGNVNCIGPRACYDEGKRMGETLCFDYARQHNISIAVARIFNTYGPRMSSSDGRVVTNFMTQALNGKPLTIFGTGEQTRSFCYCDDMIRGLVALMNSGLQGPINLGNPYEITITELAERIRALVNPALEVIYEPLPIDDPERRKPAIDRAKNLLGWQPLVDLSSGLQSTLADVRNQLEHANELASTVENLGIRAK
ncbi:MAG: UDP-glucuronic acid decarboxylase family protein [Cyanobium sp.]